MAHQASADRECVSNQSTHVLVSLENSPRNSPRLPMRRRQAEPSAWACQLRFFHAVQPRPKPSHDSQCDAGAHMSMYDPSALTSGPCVLAEPGCGAM